MKRPLISASDIGAIVKEFLGKSFKTYGSVEEIITRKFFLSKEERTKYDELKQEALSFIFTKGKDFEAETVQLLTESYKAKYKEVEIIDFNEFFPNREEGKRQKLLVGHNLSICCVPDILAITDNTNYNIIEIKSSDYNTDLIENYKYQIAMQGLLLANEYHRDVKFFNYRLILQEKKEVEIDGVLQEKTEAKTFKVAGGSKIWGSYEDVEPYQKEILVSLHRLWESFESGNLEKYRLSFEDMIKPFKEQSEAKARKEIIELEDAELVKLASEYLEEKEREKSSKYIADEIKRRLSKITDNSTTFMLQSDDGSILKASYSVSKPIFGHLNLKRKKSKRLEA